MQLLFSAMNRDDYNIIINLLYSDFRSTVKIFNGIHLGTVSNKINF